MPSTNLISPYTDSYTYYSDTEAINAMLGALPTGFYIWVIIAFILAIVGGVLAYFLFVKPKTTPKGKFAKWLKDFLSFKIMWIEPILKMIYYAATIFVILFSFTFFSLGAEGILMWLMCLVFGPIVVRLVYEMTMMFIMIWRNTRDIAENTKKK